MSARLRFWGHEKEKGAKMGHPLTMSASPSVAFAFVVGLFVSENKISIEWKERQFVASTN